MTSDPSPVRVSRGNRRWWIATHALLLLFGFGAGVLVTHLSLARYRDRHRAVERGRGERVGAEDRRGSDRGVRFRDHLREELGLTAAQQDQLDAFIAENRAEASAFWDDTHRRYRELRGRFREQIRGILTEAQDARFRELVETMDRRGGPGGRSGRRGQDRDHRGSARPESAHHHENPPDEDPHDAGDGDAGTHREPGPAPDRGNGGGNAPGAARQSSTPPDAPEAKGTDEP